MPKKKKKKTAGESLASALKEKKTPKGSDKSIGNSSESAEKTKEVLQSLLQGVSKGTGFYKREVKEESFIEPKLVYDTKSKIAEDYVMEDIPISERGKKDKKRTSLLETNTSVKEETIEKKSTQVQKPLEAKNIYEGLEIFFREYMKGYNERYNRWEESISNILSILRKMRKFTKKNTEDLIDSINNLFKKIELNLQQFKIKRDEIEKIAGVDIQTMSGEFKKVLGLLELQVKEYQLKRLTDELVHQQQTYSQI